MLCQWTQQESRWLKMTSFDLNSEEPDLDYLLGRSCYAGLDLSSTRDLTALVLVFPDYEDGTYDVLTYPFVPEDNATVREKKDRVPYLQWAKEGHIELTPGEVVDYDRVRAAMVEGYERASQLPSAGFSAGPCLLKDTMQISSFYHTGFLLGHSAMMINEGLPNFIIKQLKKDHNLRKKTVGILGLSFKAENDDIRDSLSIKLLKKLKLSKIKTLQSDEYYKNKKNIDKNILINKSDIIIIATPHKAYKNLKIKKSKVLVDIWGIFEKN